MTSFAKGRYILHNICKTQVIFQMVVVTYCKKKSTCFYFLVVVNGARTYHSLKNILTTIRMSCKVMHKNTNKTVTLFHRLMPLTGKLQEFAMRTIYMKVYLHWYNYEGTVSIWRRQKPKYLSYLIMKS